jgi:hypothetical protein
MRLFKVVESCPVCDQPGAILSWVEDWDAWSSIAATTELEAQLWECPVSGCHRPARQPA